MFKKKVLFMGTPEIGNQALITLLKMPDIHVVGVVTQPDRNFDRKKNLIINPVKQTCLEKKIKLYQPEKISLIYEELKALNLDAIITCAYGQFIPDKILTIPKYGTFNLHGSLLPKLRGGAPIHWAIINNENETGWTLMKTIKAMDAGDYCDQYNVNIVENETTSSLYAKMIEGLRIFIKEKLMRVFDDKTKWIKQDENKVTFGLNIKKEDRIINFYKNVVLVDAQIRGLLDSPVAIWKINNLEIKVFHSRISNIKSRSQPGTINKISKEGIFISTNDFDIIFCQIQLPNKSKVSIHDVYKNGTFLKNFR